MPRFALLLILLALAAAGPAFGPASAAERTPAAAPQRNQSAPALVLLVHSYDPDYAWSQGISQGVAEVLRGHAELRTLYLEARDAQDKAALLRRVEAVLGQIQALAPRVVITADDAAQELLAAPHLKGRAAPQVIFCGVNAPLSRYGFPAANVSGVRSRWHFRQSFDLLLNLAPRARRAVFLTDASESSAYVVADLRAALDRRGRSGALHVRVVQAADMAGWRQAVREAQAGADVLALGIYHSLTGDDGRPVPPEAVMAWTDAANRLPTVGFAEYAIRDGQLCGVLGSSVEQGRIAGSMARLVLERGVAAGALPPRVNERGIVLLNLKTAERLGLRVPFPLIEAAEVLVR